MPSTCPIRPFGVPSSAYDEAPTVHLPASIPASVRAVPDSVHATQERPFWPSLSREHIASVAIVMAMSVGALAALVSKPVYALGAIGLLGYLLIAMRNAWVGFVLFVLYCTFHMWLSRDLRITPTFADDALYYALLAACLVRVASTRGPLRRLHQVKRYVLLYLVYVLFQVGSALVVARPVALWGLRDSLQYSILPLLVLVIASKEEHGQRAASGYVRLAAVVSVLTIVGVAWPASRLAGVATSDTGPTLMRATATMANPNTVAYFVGLATLVYMPLMWRDTSWRHIFYPMLFAFSTFLSLSRSAFVMLPVAVGGQWLLYFGFDGQLSRLLGLLRLQRRWVLAVLFVLACGACVAFIVLPSLGRIPNLLVDRYSTSRLGSLDFVWGPRVRHWLRIWAQFGGRWLFGNGIGAVTGRSGLAYDVVVLDSLWFKLFLEQGVVGVGFVLALLCDLGRRAWRLCRSQVTRPTGLAGLTAILYLAVAGVGASMFDVFPVNVVFWSMMGFVLLEDITHRRVACPSC